jgi:peptidoglycan-associated lipoprotein
MQLQKIYFNFDSAVLSEESRSILSKNADFLSKQKSLKVRIEGNCDERGSDEYNMALGERRAKAAKDYLGNLGVDTSRLTVISYGVEKPAVDGHDEAAWAKDRRDEFVIVK